MKELAKIKLRDISSYELNIREMGVLKGGINESIMPLGDYGCDSYVCTNSRDTSSAECSTAKCRYTSCSSGA